MSSAPSPDSPTSPPPPSPSDARPPNSSPPPPSEDASPPPPDQESPPPPPPEDSNPSPPPPSSSDNDSPPPPPPPKSQNDDGNDDKSWSPPPPPSSNSNHSPPGPRSLAPGKDSSANKKSPGDGINVSVPLAVGIAGGVGVLLLLLMIVFLCSCKKKKKAPGKHEYYYSDNHPSGAYNNSPQQWNNGNQRSDLHPPGAMGAGHAPWPQAPSAHVAISGDYSSNFSGPHGPALPPPHPSVALGFTKSSFSYEELAVATGGFSQANLLGQGGFGYVHKGVLPNGKEIAVKSLKSGSGQGDREFQAEVEIISRVHHRHLVSLVGYSIAGGQKLLVYEFVPNSTLEFHLYGNGPQTMDWTTRLKIAVGSAKGLGYLHEDCHPRIIHRDIKAANILIDLNFEAKVADFGLAKLSSDNHTHVSTRVMGTFGYLAPEYASSGKLTEKSDVYSFGVLLLELITGRRPVDPSGRMDESLVEWARPLCSRALEQGLYDDFVDPALKGNYDPQEMACMVACASLAVSHSARRRPKMSQIVRALEGDISLDNLQEGMKATRSAIFSTTSESSDLENNSSYSTEMRNFRKLALDSREYPTSEFGQTSDYGLNPSSSSSEEMSKSGGVAARRNSPYN